MTTTLTQKQAAWMKAMKDADTGPLKIADEVIEVVNNWATRYSMHAGGKTCTAWLLDVFGPGRDEHFWRRRYDAVRTLGETPDEQSNVRNRWNHDAAVWAANALKRCGLDSGPHKVNRALLTAVESLRKRGSQRVAYLALVQRAAVTVDATLRPRDVARTCARCLELQKRVEELEQQLEVERQHSGTKAIAAE